MAIECDVLVVGAGPAGLTAARVLAGSDFSVVVIEQKGHGGPDTTSYDITEGIRIKDILKDINIKPHKISSKSEWFSPNYGFLLDSNIQDYYFKRGPEEDSLENMLLRNLQNDVCSIFFNSHINSCKLDDKKSISFRIATDQKTEEIKPKYVIAADGSNSFIRGHTGIKPEIMGQFNGYGAILTTPENNLIPHAKIYFDTDAAPGGYIYSGSSKNTAFVCIVTDASLKNQDMRQTLHSFINEQLPRGLPIKNYFSGVGYSGVQPATTNSVFFVGGAALFHDPFLGYGLNYALESAYILAQAIISENMMNYTTYTKEIHDEIIKMAFAREIWRNADNHFFDTLVQAFNGKVKDFDEKITKILRLFGE